jgi:two-component system, LytTR family, response regulator
MTARLRAFVVDDEPLALRRLVRLLVKTGRVEIAGDASDPEAAIDAIERVRPDILFLDIQMPRLTGFEMLERLTADPIVIFTTAYDEFALRAFEVNSVDYLLKPIDPERLDQALDKAERFRQAGSTPDLAQLVRTIARAYPPDARLSRLASRTGDRTQFVELADITHIYARDKLTYAVASERHLPVDFTIAELEQRLEPAGFVRIHRAMLVNVKFVKELDTWAGGGGVLRLSDAKRTELQVARDRVSRLKDRLGL